MKATGNRIILEVKPQEEKIGSLIIPKTVKNQSAGEGIVICLGDAGEFEVEVGDKVVYLRSDESVIDDTHVIVNHSNVLYAY